MSGAKKTGRGAAPPAAPDVAAPPKRRGKRAVKADLGDPIALERSQATREKLLAAATAGFARVGYDGYSNRMMAAETGIHHALVTYYFGSKFELWKACLMSMTQDLRVRLAARWPEAKDDTDRIRIVFEEFIRHNSRVPQFQALAADAVGRADGRFQWVLDSLGRAAHDTWRDLIASSQKAGRFVEGDPGMLLNIFLGAAVRIYIMAPETQHNLKRSPFDPAFVDEHVATVLSLFFKD